MQETIATHVDFLRQDVLPKRRIGIRDAYLLELGFSLGEAFDEQFIQGQIPEHWQKRASSKLNWYEVLDEQSRVRALVYVKDRWYDYRAKLEMTCRYTAMVEPAGGWGSSEYQAGFSAGTEFRFHVYDSGSIIFDSDPMVVNHRLSASKIFGILSARAVEWLDEHFPQHSNHEAYWRE